MATGNVAMDLDAYLARIGYQGSLDPTLETLRGLHFAHATSISFENLDILLGHGISLDLDRLQKKLVADRRGGYCFEHNTLFEAILQTLGFTVTPLAARVRFGATGIRPRSHMLLAVLVDGEPWLADVGFGGEGLLGPLPLFDYAQVEQSGWAFRVAKEEEVEVVQSLHPEGWFDLYAFTRERQYPVDFEVANHYVSTFSHSPFVQNVIAQRTDGKTRWALRNRELSEEVPGRKTTRTLADDDEVLASLANVFSLQFPPGTRFRVPSGHDEAAGVPR
jgi:N-hydroxyarylamine O-acetyltransferase